MRVQLTREAELDLEEAAEWYLARSGEEVARRFIEDYRRARSLVREAPTRWMELEPGVRRIVFHTFPYSVIYAVEDDRVLVLAVKHDKRHPDGWRRG